MRTPGANPGGRVLRQVTAGSGEPAVVLEAGMNNGAAAWDRVVPLLVPHVRVTAYDRAGIGGSGPGPVTIDGQINDLASVITGMEAGPCVLAGHSWGGMLVQLLAFRRPELVAGLVLVDPGHEDMEAGLPWLSGGDGRPAVLSSAMSCAMMLPRPWRLYGRCAHQRRPFPRCPSLC